MTIKLRAFLAAAAIGTGLAVAPAFADGTTMHGHDSSMHSMNSGETNATARPTEPGQGAFAAIAEIVALLEADPKTDWSKVNIDALRTHLVDMNELTLHAAVRTTVAGSAVTFHVTGKGRTVAAIQRMVPAHSAQLREDYGWRIAAKTVPGGAEMTVTAADLARIKALGFFGIMATGAHHQAHHFQMATGMGPHAAHSHGGMKKAD